MWYRVCCLPLWWLLLLQGFMRRSKKLLHIYEVNFSPWSCSQDTCNQWIILCEDYFSTNMATRAWLSLDATDLSFSTNGGGGWGLGGYHLPGMWVLLSFKRHHRACLNNPSFSNLGLCAACWALFMCLHELWPTSVSHLSSFLNIALGLAGEL